MRADRAREPKADFPGQLAKFAGKMQMPLGSMQLEHSCTPQRAFLDHTKSCRMAVAEEHPGPHPQEGENQEGQLLA